MSSQRHRYVLQSGEGDILCFTKIRLVELAAPLAVGYPILPATRAVLLACGVPAARTLERERTCRWMSQPANPRGRVDCDLRFARGFENTEHPVRHLGNAP
ncbi:MAG: hypothetical protein M3281_01100, partial [Chloroflexota bacterium]|nr:hypothetical protein [Chloroflexota bacterium]